MVDKNNFFVDIECTVNGGPDGDSPEAHWKNNRVLLCGYTTKHLASVVVEGDGVQLAQAIQNNINDGLEVTIVAHNAKFDIKYLMRDHPEVEWNKVKVWDTMTWEYRNSGHIDKFKSLEETAAGYGLVFKKSLNLGALLATGVKMEDIPRSKLEPYLKEDVGILKQIHAEQKALGEWDMDYILPLSEMELNGMHINVPKARSLLSGLTNYIDTIEVKIQQHIKDTCEWQDGTPIEDEDFTELGTKSKCIKAGANRTLSFMLTGAPVELKITEKWRVQYKKGHGPMYTIWKGTPNHLGYPMGEAELESCSDWLSTAVLEHRGYSKLASTYVGPFLHSASVQGTIHPKLNTTVTGTGRLSSSQPNGQNVPPTARELVIPANEDDKIVEIDFSQLEMVAAACVSGCPALLADLRDGVDVHQETANVVKVNRKVAKAVNFGLLYKGGAKGLSISTGVDIHTVKALIKAFYDRYPGVKDWQEEIMESIKDAKYPLDIVEGEQRYASTLDEPFSGRRFTWVEGRAPKWVKAKTGRKFSFSPQQASNYPIQGFAGGDIVMYALTRLWRELYGKVRFIMTVHDSIVLETDMDLFKPMLRATADTVKQFNLPAALEFEITEGNNWS